MALLRIAAEQFTTLPILVDRDTGIDKTYIVTGANVGLGLETARHLVAASAARVILAVRNLDAGEKAKVSMEQTTGRKGVVEVWHLDLASFASVKAFAARMSTLERVDSLVANAGVSLDKWTLAEGNETTMTVNIVSTLLLGVLAMPKLIETARTFGTKPRLTFVVSGRGFTVKDELAKGGKQGILDALNDPKRADMSKRYPLSKLVEMYAIREFAAGFPVSETGVIINMVSPGLCSTNLGHDAAPSRRALQGVLRAMMARTAEEGSRTILHGVIAGEESHGKHLSGCQIKENWIPEWMTDVEGQRTQRQLWKEIAARLEAVQPGCTRLG